MRGDFFIISNVQLGDGEYLASHREHRGHGDFDHRGELTLAGRTQRRGEREEREGREKVREAGTMGEKSVYICKRESHAWEGWDCRKTYYKGKRLLELCFLDL